MTPNNNPLLRQIQSVLLSLLLFAYWIHPIPSVFALAVDNTTYQEVEGVLTPVVPLTEMEMGDSSDASSSTSEKSSYTSTQDFLQDTLTLEPVHDEHAEEEGHGLEFGEAADTTTTTTTTATLTEDYTTGRAWTTSTVTFGIDSSLTNGNLKTDATSLEQEVSGILSSIKTAFQTWASYIPITFKEVAMSGLTTVANIVIQALDSTAFKTKFGTNYVAYAYYPSNGDVYFNLGYNFSLGLGGGGTSFLSTLIHELGHSLGLTHATSSTSIMYPYITGKTALSTNDVGNIQKVYGPGQGTVTMLSDEPLPEPEPEPTPSTDTTSTGSVPVFDTFPTTFTVTAGETLTFTISATDPDGGTIRLSASGLPKGAKFVDHGDGTATFTWTPTTKQASAGRQTSKTYSISFTATDAAGQSTSITTKITATKYALQSAAKIRPFFSAQDLKAGWMGMAMNFGAYTRSIVLTLTKANSASFKKKKKGNIV